MRRAGGDRRGLSGAADPGRVQGCHRRADRRPQGSQEARFQIGGRTPDRAHRHAGHADGRHAPGSAGGQPDRCACHHPRGRLRAGLGGSVDRRVRCGPVQHCVAGRRSRRARSCRDSGRRHALCRGAGNGAARPDHRPSKSQVRPCVGRTTAEIPLWCRDARCFRGLLGCGGLCAGRAARLSRTGAGRGSGAVGTTQAPVRPGGDGDRSRDADQPRNRAHDDGVAQGLASGQRRPDSDGTWRTSPGLSHWPAFHGPVPDRGAAGRGRSPCRRQAAAPVDPGPAESRRRSGAFADPAVAGPRRAS